MAEAPFDTIESAQEYMGLLAETVEQAVNDLALDLESAKDSDSSRVQALQLAMFVTKRLSFHVSRSRRHLNDLRRIRNLAVSQAAKLDAGKLRVVS